MYEICFKAVSKNTTDAQAEKLLPEWEFCGVDTTGAYVDVAYFRRAR